MASLTNSAKLITKIEAIDSSISDINDKIGTVPSGTDIMSEIGAVDDKADGIITSIGTVPSGSTVMGEIGDVASDLSTFETTVAETYATKSEISTVFKYKGSKETYSQLPSSGNVTGDVWNIEEADPTHGISAGDNVAWTGTAWDVLAGTVDLTGYYTKTNINTMTGLNAASATFSAVDVSAADASTHQVTITAQTDNQSIDGALDKDKTSITNLANAYNALETRVDSDETDISNRYTKSEINSITGLSNSTPDYKKLELSVDSTTKQMSENLIMGVDIKTAQAQNVSSFSTIKDAYNALETRVDTLEADAGDNDPVKWIDVAFSASKTAVVNDAFITAATCVDTWVVKSGTMASYAFDYQVEAGKITFTASDTETLTLRVRLIKEYVA